MNASLSRGVGIVTLFFCLSVFLFYNFVYGENTDIIITEICPTGCASSGHQWIEVYNKGEEQINLEDWIFWEGETNHSLSISEKSVGQDFLIDPNEYAIIAQNDLYFFEDNLDVTSTVFDSSWGTLNKSGEEIGLKDGDGEFIEHFIYKALEQFSLERIDLENSPDDETNWKEHPEKNSVARKNYWSAEHTEDAGDEEDQEGDAEDGDGSEDDEGVGETLESPEDDVVITNQGIVINEFLSDPLPDKKEWVELYNFSTSSVDLTSWELHDGVGKIATLSGILDPQTFLVTELSASKLNNGGDLILLANVSSTIVDTVRYGDWVDEFSSSTEFNTSKPDIGKSIARIVDGQNTGNNKNDFAQTLSPTPSEPNIITEEDDEEEEESGGGDIEPPITSVIYNDGDLVINELVSDPSDDMEEFVELFNTTNQVINLGGWSLEDGSEGRTNLNGTISANGFYVIEKPKGNLNNAGDIVILFSPSGKEIDRVSYGSWDDGNISDNAPAPKDPLSLVRKVDGLDANNDYYDFVLTNTITKGTSNVVTQVTEDGEVVEEASNFVGVIINEVFPNPKGSDNEDEFIEIFNNGNETINLKDCKLGDSSKKRYTITQGSVRPGGFIVFKRSMTGIALNNTGGDEVKIFAPNGASIDSMQYPGSSKEDESYARRGDGSWAWTVQITQGKENIIEGKSAAPIISIDTETEVSVNDWVVFDASDTTDPDGDNMTFVWNFDDDTTEDGDVVEHKFKKEGVYTVTLIVDDGKQKSEKQVVITVKLSSDFVGGYGGASDVTRLRISEFVPNPLGSDTTEFIELFNPSDEDIDVSGLKLDDEEGGSRAYTIPDNIFIKSGEYKVFGRQDTKLALNNTSDSVRLLYPDGTVIIEIHFDDVLEGHSHVRNDEGQWVWTSSVTPGEENILSAPKEVKGTKITKRSNYEKPIIKTTLNNIRNEDIGDKVQVFGVVAVEPGVLGSQYFYIVDSVVGAISTPVGVQVYMYKKDFPK
ncbi:PKD domain-containing protein, partial [Candidatus Parcubacteria bacterium]|nr:PKD domain-containing protein [Candidatus Parcubacteria bacterium]